MGTCACTHTRTGAGIALRIKTKIYNSYFNCLLIFRLQLMEDQKSLISLTQQEVVM